MPPEQLLRAMLLQAFYAIRSERQLMERIEFDLLYPCNRHYIDLVGPAFIAFAIRDMGDMSFGAVTTSLECAVGKNKRHVSFDEGSLGSGRRWAEMTSSVTITREIRFQDGDEETLEGRRW